MYVSVAIIQSTNCSAVSEFPPYTVAGEECTAMKLHLNRKVHLQRIDYLLLCHFCIGALLGSFAGRLYWFSNFQYCFSGLNSAVFQIPFVRRVLLLSLFPSIIVLTDLIDRDYLLPPLFFFKGFLFNHFFTSFFLASGLNGFYQVMPAILFRVFLPLPICFYLASALRSSEAVGFRKTRIRIYFQALFALIICLVLDLIF